jgi:hypothetical protein
MRKAQFFYLLRRGLLSGGLNLIKEGLVMASKFTTQGLSFPAQGSAEFNGTSDYIDMGNTLNQGTGNATYSFWAYVEADSAGPCAIAKSIGGSLVPNYGFLAGVFVNGSVYYFTGDSDTSTYGGAALHAGLNQWQYVSIVVDKSQTEVGIYINGSKQTTTRTLGGALSAVGNVTNTQPLVIGAESDLSNKFDGNLANVAIWNRALSSDEINSVMWKSYEGLTGAESNGLQAWYSLDDITSPAASLANMEQLATDKNATIENKAAITAAVNALS